MSFLEAFKSRILMEYKADVEQAKRAVRDLAGEQKKAAQQAVQGVEDQVKAHEQLAGKIAATAAVVGGAIAIGVAGFAKYEQTMRLTGATAGANMARLRDASRGLLTDLDLMAVAADGMNGRWRLTSSELETVFGAAVQLERDGFGPLKEIVQKLGEAVKKGEIDPLKELGVAYDETLAKTDKRAAALQALAQLSGEAAKGTAAETEAMRAHAVGFKNAVDQIATAIGALVNSLGPLIGLMSEAVQGWAIIVDTVVGTSTPAQGAAAKDLFEGRQLNFITGDGGELRFGANQAGLRKLFNATTYFLEGQQIDHRADMERKWIEEQRAKEAAAVDEERRVRLHRQKLAIEAQKRRFNGTGVADVKRGGRRQPMDPGPSGWDDLEGDLALGGYKLEELGATVAAKLAAQSAVTYDKGSAVGQFGQEGQGFNTYDQGPTILERMFGDKTEFDAYATAWTTISDVALSAYDAMVSGSMSAGKAIRQALAGAIHGIGRKMFMRGLEETAEGTVSLFTNPAAAPAHFGGAALFFAGAAIAGAVANQVAPGTTAGTSSGAPSTGAVAAGFGRGGGGAASQPLERTIVLGAGYDDETARQRAAKFARAQRTATAYERQSRGVAYQ